MSKDTEETNAGVRKKGSWREVAEFGEEVEEAMDQSRIDDTSVEEFRRWRPRRDEAENDMREKTVEQASINETESEERSNGVEDIRDASGKVAEAGKKAAQRENPEPEIREASKGVVRPLFAKTVEYLRDLEQEIYSAVMLTFNPFYLDTEDFTVDLRSKNGGDYEMDVSVTGESSREEVKERFREENG